MKFIHWRKGSLQLFRSRLSNHSELCFITLCVCVCVCVCVCICVLSRSQIITHNHTTHTHMCSGHFCQKFCTLKQELLTMTAASKIEMSARLAQELGAASEKYFVIKRMFWEVRFFFFFFWPYFHELKSTDNK